MQELFRKYVLYMRGVSGNRPGQIGVILTTSSFFTFIILETARVLGFITNAYIGLVTYMAIPVIFIVGLILIPLGWRRLKKKTGKTGKELMAERFDSENVRDRFAGSKIFITIAVLTLANIVFLSVLSGRMLKRSSRISPPRRSPTFSSVTRSPTAWISFRVPRRSTTRTGMSWSSSSFC